RAILARVLELGGTISGEHGIGEAKMPFVPMELSPASMRLQKGIKRLFDPNLILNPGKIFEDL
ncbi:FAD-linked oxidase C-terminal domain-containing protein, partial [Desulfocurvibacter africanus]